jgi:hypothetical protein
MRRCLPCTFILLALAFSLIACADPPSKEMNQAQGAIDAARAVGADRFAADEFTAAVEALKRSDEAVAARDYRQALSHALDSRERAQNAAKLAVEARARARGDAEGQIAGAAVLVERLNVQLRDSRVKRMPARTQAAAQSTARSVSKALQDARSALERGDYAVVSTLLKDAQAQIQAALEALEPPSAAPPPKRSR